MEKTDDLTRRRGTIAELGDDRLINMELVVSKPENLPEQLRVMANDSPTLECPSLLD
jgi:hypothetical protein